MNEPAFPQQEEFYTADPVRPGTVRNTVSKPGMTLRDYFAAKALYLVNSSGLHSWTVESFANYAYRIADAMLAEREKSKP